VGTILKLTTPPRRQREAEKQEFEVALVASVLAVFYLPAPAG
jgi:hypothetical protein